jgi:ABC-type transport system substrate-binding protein
VSAAGGTIVIPNMVYNRLLGMRGGPNVNVNQAENEPELASSWERTPDGLTFTIKIRNDVTWQNVAPLSGRAFVAEDAKLAYERYQTTGVHQSYWNNVAAITATDEHTLTITLKAPTADFLLPLGSRYQTIFPHELVDDGSIETKAIGTGPMILKEAVASSHVIWEKNPDYWERDVLLDGANFRLMPDSSARLAAFRTGQIEYGYAVADSIRAVDSLVDTNPDIQINMVAGVYGGIPFGVNNSSPKFQDERVRRAISMSIDREALTQVLYDGLGQTLLATPWPFAIDERPTLDNGLLGPWVKFDLAEAKSLLEAAGAADLTMNNAYFAYGDYLNRLAEALVDQFRQAGITMTGGKVDYTEFNSTWVGGKLDEVTTSGWATVGFDADNFYYNQIHSASPGNRWRINDPKLDEMAEAQRFELDADARREIHRQMYDYEADMMFRPPLPSAYSFEIYQPWVRGLRFGGSLGDNSSYYDWGDQVAEIWLDK